VSNLFGIWRWDKEVWEMFGLGLRHSQLKEQGCGQSLVHTRCLWNILYF